MSRTKKETSLARRKRLAPNGTVSGRSGSFNVPSIKGLTGTKDASQQKAEEKKQKAGKKRKADKIGGGGGGGGGGVGKDGVASKDTNGVKAKKAKTKSKSQAGNNWASLSSKIKVDVVGGSGSGKKKKKQKKQKKKQSMGQAQQQQQQQQQKQSPGKKKKNKSKNKNKKNKGPNKANLPPRVDLSLPPNARLALYVGMDCEMVGVGPQAKSALARCSIVDYNGEVVYDKFIRPQGRIRDYRTRYSGVREKDMRTAPPVSRGERFGETEQSLSLES